MLGAAAAVALVPAGAAGELTHRWTHDAWGAHRTVTAMDPAAPGPTVSFSSTVAAASAGGLVHMRARDYDPATGQFLSPDPWQRPDGQPWVGVHAYVDGNPVSFWDPQGLRPKRPGAGGTCQVGPWTLPTWASGGNASGCKGGDLGASARVCPFFGCVGVGANVDGDFYVSGGVGLVVEFPGGAISPGGDNMPEACGGSSSNNVYGTSPVGQLGWGWEGSNAAGGSSTSHFAWDGRGREDFKARLGGGYVHEWAYRTC